MPTKQLIPEASAQKITGSSLLVVNESISSNGTLAYTYTFGKDDQYQIVLANDRERRRKAWNLVYNAYRQINYVAPDPSELRLVMHDASPATTTFLVVETGNLDARATFTLTPDSPLGLPLEMYYSAEVQALRDAGRKPCEISKLVACSLVDADQPGVETLLNAFKLAYLTARRLENCSDIIIAVVPRHVDYYQKLLLFEPFGEARSYKSLNDLVTVPLRLDLLKAEGRYRGKFCGLPGRRNLYKFFINDQEPVILDWLRKQRRPMSAADFKYFFMEQTQIYWESGPSIRAFMADCYPGCQHNVNHLSSHLKTHWRCDDAPSKRIL